jgi:hypothetical protein
MFLESPLNGQAQPWTRNLHARPGGARSAVTGADDEIRDGSMARHGHPQPVQGAMMTLGIAAIVLAVAYITVWLRQAMPDNAWRKPPRRT